MQVVPLQGQQLYIPYLFSLRIIRTTDGVDIVITTMGLTTSSVKFTAYDIDYQGNLNLYNEAKKAGEDLKDDATDALKSMEGKNTDDAIDSLMDSISKAVEKRTGQSDGNLQDTLDQMSKVLKELDSKLGKESGNLTSGFNDIINNAKDFVNSDKFTDIQKAMTDLGNEFKNGLSNGTQSLDSLVNTIKDAFNNNP